jgi:hypothetical protein
MLKQAPQEANEFYNTDEAYARYMKLAAAAASKAEKAEKRKIAAGKRREEANTEFASNELFAVPSEFDPSAKTNAKAEVLAAEREYEDAEAEVMATRKAAVTAAAVAMRAARDYENSEPSTANNEPNTGVTNTEPNTERLNESKSDMNLSSSNMDMSASMDNGSLMSDDDDSSVAGRKSEQEAEVAKKKAEQAAKDAEEIESIKEKCAKDPEAHAETVQLAFETLTEVCPDHLMYICNTMNTK